MALAKFAVQKFCQHRAVVEMMERNVMMCCGMRRVQRMPRPHIRSLMISPQADSVTPLAMGWRARTLAGAHSGGVLHALEIVAEASDGFLQQFRGSRAQGSRFLA